MAGLIPPRPHFDMAKTEEVLRLIVIDDSSNDAEVVSSMLRNAGHAVRAERAEDDEDLRTLLAQQSWDMVLTKAELPHFTALDTLHLVSQMESDTPVVVLADEIDDGALSTVLKAGPETTGAAGPRADPGIR